jgi:Fur family zinc uptake transcriptional regulator
VKAYDLLAALQQEDQAAKPPTIYRALDFLMSLGLIHKIHSLNAYLGCAHPAHPEEALLLICKDCEEVIEITSPTLTTTLSNIYQKQQFTPHTSVLEVMGQCRDCLT